jgi:hypothetical protein
MNSRDNTEIYKPTKHVLYSENTSIQIKVKIKVKLSRYTPWRRLGGEEV